MSSLNIESWSPSDVAQWIKGLGSQFESCSESFVDEEINGKALLTLNTEYLSELSIENINDQNAVLDAVHCLVEVDTCLQGETVHGQVVVVNDQTKDLIEKLEKERQEANEGDVNTSDSLTKVAGQIYQLAKKLLSWLIRSPFSEMNACWPLKDSVCRVVRDMTDESLLKNREHLQENLTKLQLSFDNFLNEDPLHEVFKQPPILVHEEFILEGEGLGIGITTSHLIHTVNSVSTESPAGKNGNIKNGDEIVNVNGQCVIAWPQKNVISLMKSKPDTVSLTLKKLPPVKGPLNKPVDKPGTPLSEMNVVMDRSKVAPERPPRVEMKEAGIKEETSLEMQAIENENEVEENSKTEEKIEGIQEEVEVEGKPEEGKPEENKKEELHYVDIITEKQAEELKKAEGRETSTKDENVEEKDETETVVDGKQDDSTSKENEEAGKNEEVVVNEVQEVLKSVEDAGGVDEESAAVVLDNNAELTAQEPEKIGTEVSSTNETNIEVNGETEIKQPVEEAKNDVAKVVNGEAAVEMQKKEPEKIEDKKQEEVKPKMEENEAKVEIKVEAAPPKKRQAPTPSIALQNDENGTTSKIEPPDSPTKNMTEPVSPSRKPARPELRKMKMGSVKTVTVDGASAKQVEVYGTTNVVRREKKIDGAPNKRISCIELGEADCEGWLTKKSGGHGLTPTRWRRQWCVLKEEHLYYYKTSFDREAGGVIDITGYKMSAAPEVKKPFAFKCEKEGGKKYWFHADNEGDRESWINLLNASSRGERKAKETMSEAGEHKASTSLKPAPSNRPRAGSVLAVGKFNYYDDDVIEESRSHEPSVLTTTAQRVNESLQNGESTKPSTAAVTDQNILKIAVGVEEDACQVVPVGEIEGQKVAKSQSEVEAKGELGTVVSNSEQEGTSEGKTEQPAGDKQGEVCANVDIQSEANTPDVKVGDTGVIVDSMKQIKTNKDTEIKTEVNEQTVKLEDSTVESEECTTKSEDITAKSDDGTEKSEESASKHGDDNGESKEVSDKSTAEPEDDSPKSEDCTKESEESRTEPKDASEVSEESITKPEDGAEKSEEATTTPVGEAKASEEKVKDDFQEVADSLKDADIGIDGSEKSPEALLRRLSLRSKSEIMDKVVQLRVLKQNLKDKEQSMDAIDELLSSDVTPESIADWRAKYETVTKSNSNSNDLNENSEL